MFALPSSRTCVYLLDTIIFDITIISLTTKSCQLYTRIIKLNLNELKVLVHLCFSSVLTNSTKR